MGEEVVAYVDDLKRRNADLAVRYGLLLQYAHKLDHGATYEEIEFAASECIKPSEELSSGS